MNKLRIALKLYCEGKSKLFISNYLRLSRNTVKKYIKQFESLKISFEELSDFDDVKLEDGSLEIYTLPDQLLEVRHALDSADASPTTVEIAMVPKSTVALGVKEAAQTLKLLDSLEDLADVQKAYTNADFPAEVLQRYQEVT